MEGRRKKRDAQWECMLRYREEELRMAGRPSTNQQRFLRAASHGDFFSNWLAPWQAHGRK